MSSRRMIVVLLLLLTACAPSPSFDGIDRPPPTTLRAQPGTVPAPTVPAPTIPSPTSSAPAPTEPVAIRGRIVVHGSTAAIRTGTREIPLDTGDLPSQPTWARDGSRLAIVSLDGLLPVVDVFDGRTGTPIQRSFAERQYFFFSWSHDGTRIAALGPGPTGTTLDILDADGTPLHTDVVSAGAVFVAWEPDGRRLAIHADDSLLRVDDDGTLTDLGVVGADFSTPKWIPGSSDILLVVDVEGTSTLVRRGIAGGDSMTTFGSVESDVGIAVDPDGRLAALTTRFDSTSSAGPSPTGFDPVPPVFGQAATPSSGRVEMVDLATGDRVLVIEEFGAWTEWSPDGSQLLIATIDSPTIDSATIDARETATWWILDTTVVEAAAPEIVTTFRPGPVFAGSYLPFSDQYIEQPRLWSPAGTHIVYAEATDDGSVVRIVRARPAAEPMVVGTGEVGFWSPSL